MQHALHWATLEDHLDSSAGAECSSLTTWWPPIKHRRYLVIRAFNTSVSCIHGQFQVQFNILIIIPKAPHSLESEYLKSASLLMSLPPVWSFREVLLQILPLALDSDLEDGISLWWPRPCGTTCPMELPAPVPYSAVYPFLWFLCMWLSCHGTEWQLTSPSCIPVSILFCFAVLMKNESVSFLCFGRLFPSVCLCFLGISPSQHWKRVRGWEDNFFNLRPEMFGCHNNLLHTELKIHFWFLGKHVKLLFSPQRKQKWLILG